MAVTALHGPTLRRGCHVRRLKSYSPAGPFAQPRPLNAYSPCARTRLLSTARGDSSPQAHTACDQGVRTGTVGCTAIGASAPATHRRRLNGTRRSCVGHRREPLLSMADHGRACQATHADHRKGRTSPGGSTACSWLQWLVSCVLVGVAVVVELRVSLRDQRRRARVRAGDDGGRGGGWRWRS